MMKITLEYLQRDGLLVKHLMLPLHSNADRGVFIGIYSRQFFENITEFSEMLFRISSITQDWYSYGDLEEAFDDFIDGDSTRHSTWLDEAAQYRGTLRDWLDDNDVDVDLNQVPAEANGMLYAQGDSDDFTLLIKNHDYFIDVFLADRT